MEKDNYLVETKMKMKNRHGYNPTIFSLETKMRMENWHGLNPKTKKKPHESLWMSKRRTKNWQKFSKYFGKQKKFTNENLEHARVKKI